MTISTIEDVVIIASRKLVAGARFLRYVVDRTDRPAGELIIPETPTRYSLGDAAKLVYIDAESVEDL